MQYLFSFTTQDGPMVRFQSHIMDCAAPGELTGDAIDNTVATLKFEYGLSTITVQGVQPLPDEVEHPSAGLGWYVYLVGYATTASQGSGSGFGWAQIMRPEAITSMRTLREAEENLRSVVSAYELHLTSCVPLREPSAEMREQIEDPSATGEA